MRTLQAAWAALFTSVAVCEAASQVVPPGQKVVQRPKPVVPRGYRETFTGIKCPVCHCTPQRGHNIAAHRAAGKPL